MDQIQIFGSSFSDWQIYQIFTDDPTQPPTAVPTASMNPTITVSYIPSKSSVPTSSVPTSALPTILTTLSPTTTQPSTAPSLSPTSSVPTQTVRPSTTPSFLPSSIVPTQTDLPSRAPTQPPSLTPTLIPTFLKTPKPVIVVTYRIVQSATCIPPKSNILTNWIITGGIAAANMDWIGIYMADQCGTTCPSTSNSYSYVSTANSSGTTILAAPSKAGTYYAYYLPGDGYTYTAVSAPFVVASSCSTPRLSLSPTTVSSGASVTVSWLNVATTNTNDFVAFMTIGTAPPSGVKVPTSWAYTYGGQVASGASPSSTGSVVLTAPPTTGTYVVYYCTNNGQTNCPASAVIIVTVPVTVTLSPMVGGNNLVNGGSARITWTAPKSYSSDWVGLFVVGAADSQSSAVWYVSTKGTTSGSFSKIAPGAAGVSYQARYYSGSVRKATSETVVTKTPLQAGLQCLPKKSSNSNIQNVVIIIQENQSFDHYFATYCKAPQGSNPTCTTGPSCCESGPSSYNVDIPGPPVIYRGYAATYAINDRYFVPNYGASSGNDQYFARGAFVFPDNSLQPFNTTGKICYPTGGSSFNEQTIMEVMDTCGVTWTWYGEGYDFVKKNPKKCYPWPYYYDPTDTAHQYYPKTRDTFPQNRDFSTEDSKGNILNRGAIFNADVAAHTLPQVSYIKFLGTSSEHNGMDIPTGENAVNSVVNTILNSKFYYNRTLVILTYDEWGYYSDHIPAMGISTADNMPTGLRTNLMTLGYFSKKNYISHAVRDHSSLIRFLEWNFLGANGVGILQTRDANPDGWTNNIGDMLQSTGVAVPSN
mmetsp:Transcript_25176/g.34613  ORF Transcript_25176/g.34613 Transcript_25176/m.34613 type:complete len:814 (+) Transcript_25176:216-2657(+)